jgi:hypothetical protein
MYTSPRESANAEHRARELKNAILSPRGRVRAVGQLPDAFLARAVGAAEESAVSLVTVSDHCATAVLTPGGETMNGAFEGVEYVALTGGRHLDRLVVVIPQTSQTAMRSSSYLLPPTLSVATSMVR